MSKLRILIADDHSIVRHGLRFVLENDPELEVVGEATDGREAVRLAEELRPRIIVMDIGMPQLNGLEATAQIVKRDPETAVIILSVYTDEIYLVRALKSGVKGYLVKGSIEDDLITAVRIVASGKCFFSPEISQLLAQNYTRQLQREEVQDSYDLLTEREKEILQLLAEGRSNKEAAAILNVSPYTVETHRMHFMQKLNLHNRGEIALYAVRNKIIS
jgi:two-component system, NarL family, response regulator NreC